MFGQFHALMEHANNLDQISPRLSIEKYVNRPRNLQLRRIDARVPDVEASETG
jgi:hypothetical protein